MEQKRAVQAQEAARATVITFGECATAYIRANEDGWKNAKHRQQWANTLKTYVLPVMGKLPVAQVDVADVKTALDPIWGRKHETATRVRGRIEQILDYATAHKYRTGENPARVQIIKQLLGKVRSKVKHHPAIPYKHLPDLMGKLDGRDDIPALALQWLILTATRSSEARCVTYEELDVPGKWWTIPPHRMKGGEEHTVPLSAAALEVLKRAKRRPGCAFVFAAQGDAPVSDTALRNLLRDLEYDRHAATLHGMRSSFRDWCAEMGVADDVAEACLAHAVPDAVVKAYKRTRFIEARRDVMQRWGLFLS